jgi:hypothetical protein
VSRSDALNLEAISKAIDQHNANCGFPAVEVALNHFEVERLGWDEIRGLPVVGDKSIETGRFQVRCERDKAPSEPVHAHAKEKVPAGGVG